ncbi:MAG: FAD-dependent oxidoreductase [Dehalobacter sp. 4CP]|uniref:FAD-dependent oxidoreductase n=1 Tax=Dehalobacter sp. CP TaxID=2594474 RepID=UPI0013C65441|nr:FAD-dependent oxidoreductase [Dehalobacter sp. 4CP]
MSDYDAIVVGAGPAGLAAAYRLAKAGVEVLVIERGSYPGAKNLSGGLLFGRILRELIPKFPQEAPLERHINRYILTFMTEDSTFNLDFKGQGFSQEPHNGYSVLRAKFDRWLGEKAEEAGATLITNIKVDSLLMENNVVKGIVAGEEEMTANVVIAADGVLSFLAEQAGLRDRYNPANFAVGVKELIGLDRTTLEERFGLTGNEGTEYAMLGYPTKGVSGGAFFYTNADSISVGLVMHIDHTSSHQVSPSEALEDFLAHPAIAPLIRGGKVLEYGAHVVPEGGYNALQKLFTDGLLVVGDAAGLGSNNGFTVRGMDLAIASGIYAADTILEAKAKGDFSAATLASYKKKLEDSFVLKDMKTYAGAAAFMKGDRLFNAYPKLVEGIFTSIYTQESIPKENLLKSVLQARKENGVSYMSLGSDVWKAVKNL